MREKVIRVGQLLTLPFAFLTFLIATVFPEWFKLLEHKLAPWVSHLSFINKSKTIMCWKTIS